MLTDEEKGRNELDTLKGMVERWRDCYFGWAVQYGPTDDGKYDWVWEEFHRAFLEYGMEKYVERLRECEYVSDEDLREFYEFVRDQVNMLKDVLDTLVIRRDEK